MTRALGLAAAAAVGVVVVGGSCVQDRPFRCESAEECVIGEARGLCQEGYCAYFDPECPNELRYEQNAGDGFGGQCIEFMDELGCGLFCEVWFDVCADAVPIYENLEQCLDSCVWWPVEEGLNSLECRYSAVLEAQTSEDLDSCIAATPSGGEGCVEGEDNPSCGEYCDLSLERCGGLEDLPEGTTCHDLCLGFRPGYRGDETGNTVACRVSLLENYDLDEETVCSGAHLESFEACVD